MSTTSTQQDVERVIVAAIVRLGPEPDDVSRDATFEALDIDSLDLVELAQIIEDEFGVQLQAADVKELRTVGDAIEMVAARTQ